ncbi:MAG: S41 family peptidase [Patescibacteria group bacterium]
MFLFFKKRYFTLGISLAATVVLIGGSFYFGFQRGFEKGFENPKTVIIRGVSNLEEGQSKDVDFSIFWNAWQIIKNKYVGTEKLKDQDLVYGAVSGLLGALGDDYSVFMPPTDAEKFNEDISGEFSGVGMEIGIRNEQLMVIAPLKETPAEKAGLRAMDKILKINETSTIGLSVDEAVKLIRGKKGTTVILTIIRNDWEKPKEISIIRDTIQIPTLDLEIKNGNIAYFKLNNFYEKAPMLFYNAALKAALSGSRGIILDLRNNPGGYLEVAVNLAGWFLDRGELVVSEEFGSGKKQEFTANGSGFFKNLPIVVLINEGSASASEILAGALRDNRGVKLIGKKSFGKGSVQELQTLKDNSMIKITTAHWLLPKGQMIEKNGLAPDYEVDLTEEDIKAGNDPQLEKAIKILKSQLK